MNRHSLTLKFHFIQRVRSLTCKHGKHQVGLPWSCTKWTAFPNINLHNRYTQNKSHVHHQNSLFFFLFFLSGMKWTVVAGLLVRFFSTAHTKTCASPAYAIPRLKKHHENTQFIMMVSTWGLGFKWTRRNASPHSSCTYCTAPLKTKNS